MMLVVILEPAIELGQHRSGVGRVDETCVSLPSCTTTAPLSIRCTILSLSFGEHTNASFRPRLKAQEEATTTLLQGGQQHRGECLSTQGIKDEARVPAPVGLGLSANQRATT